jgi:hypothetical protein
VEPLLAAAESGGLRKRTVGSQGRIRITLIFDMRTQELKIFVHEALGLPGQGQLILFGRIIPAV